MRPILVTSALPYANGSIHLGHLVEYVQTDIWVRFHKIRGRNCLYFCADDTHGTPIMIRARNEGITPEALVERIYVEHKTDFRDFLIGFDHYHSTNSEENKILSEEIYLANRKAGHIHTASVMQAYCAKDGIFLPDRFIRGSCPSCGALDQYGDSCEVCSATYSPLDLNEARCSLCGTPPEERESEHYFFNLSNFESFLKEWTHSGALQVQMANKLSEWFNEGLKAWDISRDGPYFGFEIPDAPGKYFYVWLDAPVGYMAASWSYFKQHGIEFDRYWRQPDQVEVYHFIGKDILYFHTLFWPAMLKGAGFRTPTGVFAHGFLTVNGQKMSKSRGTFITARSYLQQLDPEYLRYYYAAKLGKGVDDIDLNLDDFIQRVNSDLVGKVVNLASRTAGFIHKHFQGQLSRDYPEDRGLFKLFLDEMKTIAEFYHEREFARAMRAIMNLADHANRYVEEKAPWTLARDNHLKELQETCTVALNLFRLLMVLLHPVLPSMAEKTRVFLNLQDMNWTAILLPITDTVIQPFRPLMQRVDPKKVAAMVAASMEETPPSAHSAPSPVPVLPVATEKRVDEKPSESQTIDMDSFMAVDLRVAKVIQAETVTGADKLLRLVLDVGPLGVRNVLAGIRSAYMPEQLLGRLVVLVANLQPRKMKFGVSEGMVLAAGDGAGGLFLLSADSGAQPGMRIK
ncbi:MAG: methionine--tRNA ligase [Magnetococcales bacterium]|nr:methionine--tRNA ligase [Magnetococcales bacterium]